MILFVRFGTTSGGGCSRRATGLVVRPGILKTVDPDPLNLEEAVLVASTEQRVEDCPLRAHDGLEIVD